MQNQKQHLAFIFSLHLATSRQQSGVQRLLIRNLKVLLCCWCSVHSVPVPASSLGLSSPQPRLGSPSLNIPRPPTLNFPNLKSISVWKSTINFIFPGYIMPHFCQYKRKRKCLLKHYLYFSSPSMECRYYLLCHFIKKCSCTEIHLISWNSFFQSVLCDIIYLIITCTYRWWRYVA